MSCWGVLGLCLACGVDYGTAAALGNVAGGLEVERWGISPLGRKDLLTLEGGSASAMMGISPLGRKDLLLDIEVDGRGG